MTFSIFSYTTLCKIGTIWKLGQYLPSIYNLDMELRRPLYDDIKKYGMFGLNSATKINICIFPIQISLISITLSKNSASPKQVQYLSKSINSSRYFWKTSTGQLTHNMYDKWTKMVQYRSPEKEIPFVGTIAIFCFWMDAIVWEKSSELLEHYCITLHKIGDPANGVDTDPNEINFVDNLYF